MSQRILLVIAFFLMLNLSAQQESISSFNVITINYKHSSRIFAYAEGQLRGIKDFSYPDYYELKGGVGYQIAQNHKGLIGIGRYGNYQNHALEKEEFRIWLQDIVDLKSGKFKFENRVRAEKSWFYNPLKDEHSDRIRLRYRLNVSVPLNSNKVKSGTLSANVYEEVFFVVTDDPLFARNRVFGGFSYQIDPAFGLSAGYMWQREFAETGNKNIHFLYLGLSINIDRTKFQNKDLPDRD
ncbi:DUF2490 domain-containing protein [Kaistella yonginensis]|uniref:DUF2490 domain-containing protein n=1 Tax=Kaistella yonginensis TaxID=658267 RepID=UPI0025B5FBBF|nr:DUF2490 domain-containing protein [Kaistella yonginensis]